MHVLIADDHDLVRHAPKLLLVRIDPKATIVDSGSLKDAQESDMGQRIYRSGAVMSDFCLVRPKP